MNYFLDDFFMLSSSWLSQRERERENKTDRIKVWEFDKKFIKSKSLFWKLGIR